MKEETLKEEMEKYGEIRYQLDGLKSAKEKAINDILSKYPEIQQQIDDLEEELGKQIKQAEKTEKSFRKKLDGMIEEFSQTAIVKDVLELKTKLLKVKIEKKVSYDATALDGYSTSDPRLLAFRSEEMKTRVELNKL